MFFSPMNFPNELDDSDSSKMERQIAREKSAVEDVRKRFREQLKRKPKRSKPELLSGHSLPATELIRKYWEPLADAIRAEQTLLLTKARKYGVFMLALDADSMAVIVLHALLEMHEIGSLAEDDDESFLVEEENEKSENRAQCEDEGPDTNEENTDQQLADPKGTPLTRLAREIARRCKHHWDGMLPESQNEGILRCIEKYSPTIKMRETDRIRELLFAPWPQKNRDIPLGERLIDIAREVGILTITMGRLPRRRREAKLVNFSAGFERAFIEWRKHYKELAPPFRRPMIYPPRPWRECAGGGYLEDGIKGSMPMIKQRMDAGAVGGILRKDWGPTHTAINAIQNTAWRINKRIFDTMRDVSHMHQTKKPLELERKKLARLLSPIKRRGGVAYGIDIMCDACADIKDEEAIYFPYQLDYRGRAYCVPTGVNPQSDDIGRTLLEFSAAHELGRRGLFWLAVNLANSWGRDESDPMGAELGKKAYRERLAWLRRNSNKVIESAQNPCGNTWWMKANRPWRFLAACFDWQGYRTEGLRFESHLPITVDGTCNGLQHLSALGRSNTVARETNLEPADSPHDIYQRVALDLKASLEADRSAGNLLAIEWLKLEINRDLCKAAVMTTPYGITEQGITVQLFESDITAPLHVPGYGDISSEEVRRHGVLAWKLAKAGGQTPPAQLDAKLSACLAETEGRAVAGGNNKTLAADGKQLRPRSPDLIGKFIWEKLSSETRRMISTATTIKKIECASLVSDLNAIFSTTFLAIVPGFAELRLSDETKNLWESQELNMDERFRLNRLLLGDAYPKEIRRSERRRWECCKYLSEKLSHAIRALVDPHQKMKKWFENTAKPFPDSKVGIAWTAPSGFPVCQRSVKMERKRVKAGKYSLVIYIEKKPLQIDFQAQKRKIVPNFIHSMDAAHMMLTIENLHYGGRGHRDFGVIHDGYAMHACFVDDLQEALREEFVKMHKGSILEALGQQQVLAGRGIQDPPPVMGDFDIERVRDSRYFFC